MSKPSRIGWADARSGSQHLHLGTCYRFSGIPTWMQTDGDLPPHGYAVVYAFHIQPPQRISLKWLPYPEGPITQLPLQPLNKGMDAGHIQMTAVPALSIVYANRHVRQLLKITAEHIDLIRDNPELLADWKLTCLYPMDLDRVQATYHWLTAQSDWFDMPPDSLDWDILTQALIDLANRSNDDNEGNGGIAIPIF